jgi:hypothetical protein
VSSASPSRARLLPLTAAAVTLVAFTAACDSTEQKAARAHVQAARIIASQSPLLVRRADPRLQILKVTLIRRGARLAVAVRLRNRISHPLNDVPISVGVHDGGRTIYLNRAAGLDYFQAHVAEIPARTAVTWVLAMHARRGLVGSPFAVAGRERAPAITTAVSIPRIRAVLAGSKVRRRADTIRVTVTNLSAVPQYQLQVFALAPGPRTYSAVGSASVPHLGTGSSTTMSIGLIGDPRRTPIEVEALPTLFR